MVKVDSCIDTWTKLVHEPINSSTHTRRIAKLGVDVGDYTNANVAVFVSTYVYENVADYVDVCMKRKFFISIDKAKWLCYNGLTK